MAVGDFVFVGEGRFVFYLGYVGVFYVDFRSFGEGLFSCDFKTFGLSSFVDVGPFEGELFACKAVCGWLVVGRVEFGLYFFDERFFLLVGVVGVASSFELVGDGPVFCERSLVKVDCQSPFCFIVVVFGQCDLVSLFFEGFVGVGFFDVDACFLFDRFYSFF